MQTKKPAKEVFKVMFRKFACVLLVGCLMLSGCEGDEPSPSQGIVVSPSPSKIEPEPSVQPSPSVSPPPETSDTSIYNLDDELIAPVDSVDIDGMTLYWESSDYIRLTSDSDAKVYIYVDAEKHEGEFLFDTGQNWMLIVETFMGYYPLFPRQWVQHGGVSCDIYYADSGNAYDIFHVLITVRYSTGYEVYECVFDDNIRAFRVAPVFSALNINPMANSHIK
jgi:hypothetical protein